MEDAINPLDFRQLFNVRFGTDTISSSIKDAEELVSVLKRRAIEIHTYSELVAKLAGVNQLRIKLGMDPTAPDVTLGHMVPLLIARQFQDWGHKVIIIIGDFTATVGDPSGVDKTRPMLSEETIRKNSYTYLDQIGRILRTDKDALEIRRNSEWLSKVNIVKLASKKTVQQMLSRDSFRKRFDDGHEIRLHEFLYPLFQGWDSVEICADIELGGSDQLFNNMVGRDLQAGEGFHQQCVICTPLLVGLDGVEKMSKSKGNYIGVSEAPEMIYGKIMSLPDSAMPQYFQLLTDVEEGQYKSAIEKNPRDAKAWLARIVVARLYNEENSNCAEEHFDSVVRNRQIPDDIVEIQIDSIEHELVNLVSTGFTISKTQAALKINEGAVRIDGEKVVDPKHKFMCSKPSILQFGKRRFVRLIPK